MLATAHLSERTNYEHATQNATVTGNQN